MSGLNQVLESIRESSSNDTELGTAFEGLSKVFFEHDSTQTQQYSRVWRYEDWARSRPGYSNTDIGIDLVAELADESGYAAIQCKFYDPDHSISKSDLDSFISASATADFKRLVLIDTSNQTIGKNAQSVFDNLDKDYLRIQTTELEESRIDWTAYLNENRVHLKPKKEVRDHQIQAVEAVREGFTDQDRGKLIMACGTGKTFTSLVIAETMFGLGKKILYMVPSLALMSQSIREWKNDSKNEFTAFSACSDVFVGKRKSSDDEIEVSLNDLAFPATTDASALAEQVTNADPDKMTVVFSTYQSIDVISQAQNKYGMSEFDLVICDEAHRTTGATLRDEDESNFVRIHKNEYVQAKKRLYMTATPRIFGERAKRKAGEGDVELASMDDEDTFGRTFFYRGFSWAVENNLLTDYKVIVLAVDEGTVSGRLQQSLVDGAELKLDDATKIVGCYKALAKIGLDEKRFVDSDSSPVPMKRALAFSQTIKLSQLIATEFNNVVDEYETNEDIDSENKAHLGVEVLHVDGTFNAAQRNDRLNWLKEDIEDNQCRVLTNVRCLSEGVDVPALDAIMFLHPRKSQIDVVQAVGRVMRKAERKDLGYVILPITVAPGVDPATALNNNEKYKVVWQILNALRAHDERFDSTINRIGLGEDVSDRLEIIGVGSQTELDATTAVVEDIKSPKAQTDGMDTIDLIDEGSQVDEFEQQDDAQLAFVMSDLTQAIRAKIVEKCGTRDYWENWAADIANIAQTHITRINSLVLNSGTPERESFLEFLNELRDDLNPEISESDAVEMLAQHIITKPVFDSLFHGNQFTSENAISKAMGSVLVSLYHQNIEAESESLTRFYQSVERRSSGLVTIAARQTLILELYDRFFRHAFPQTTEKLGIVYTPVEIVDFIIHSVNEILKEDFHTSLGEDGVHVLDPFTGTGTFVTRLLQSGLIPPKNLLHKYKNEIHANEIVLLAYYIAAINIEAVYQDLAKEQVYQPFDGIVLTDTFQMYEEERDMVANLLPDNADRRTAQKNRDIKVIVGNPPYSMGQRSENDNAANTDYPNLDRKIEVTYSDASKATLKKGLYDSYIRAFRWASDRIDNEGVIGFVTNSGWIDKSFADGMRKCLNTEFSTIYIVNLRGDIRKNILSKIAPSEGENVFGSGSMNGISISVLVKNTVNTSGKILYFDIGDGKSRDQKLGELAQARSVRGVSIRDKFTVISPDKDNDWINQGDKQFRSFISIGDKSKNAPPSLFKNYSLGVATNRDAWCYNYSRKSLAENLTNFTSFYNEQLIKYEGVDSKKKSQLIDRDRKKIAWTHSLIKRFTNGQDLKFSQENIRRSLYRPFSKTSIYFDRSLNERVYQTPKIFPAKNTENVVIAVAGVGSQRGFSVFISDVMPDLQLVQNGQCFPLKLFDGDESDGEPNSSQSQMFANHSEASDGVTDGITDEGLRVFLDAYPGEDLSKEDIFYYTYGLLHSPEYRDRFKNNLSKELPRIPPVRQFEDFVSFSQSGRKLSELHLGYENVEPYSVTYQSELIHSSEPKAYYRVEQMRFSGKRPNLDRSSVIYNENITMRDIPLEAYEYIVNGKSALEWVMERQVVKIDKASGLVNDANDYANETMNNPAYPLELFQRVITVSLETMKIVRNLPKLEID
ncbi:DEAD/DEAH box helicase [SAR202 cluster bacterium JH702]|uniref:DEAD/DEAH box helicase n=2 Tax=Candidatus Lucifugimonas marina TaxID=3038979 RepID=A0ABD4XU71_9CHLR|nr:DEAD/DEAH box helicase [SAR202 cluster bacterium JH702]